jgi:hypothetical protein
MTVEELVDLAASGYPEPHLVLRAQRAGSGVGDSLASFVAHEVADSFVEGSGEAEMVRDAMARVDRGLRDLEGVRAALRRRLVALGDIPDHRLARVEGMDRGHLVLALQAVVLDMYGTYTPAGDPADGLDGDKVQNADTLERLAETLDSFGLAPDGLETL